MSDNKIKYAFRIVHIDNIPYILENGIVNTAKSTKKDDSYISIGDESLIEMRRNQNIIHTESCIGDYIPFYFGPRTPMLYTIQHGYNGVRKCDATNLVYLVLKISDIIKSGFQGYFTDGHARNICSHTYEIDKLNQLNELVHYENVYRPYWSTKEDNRGEYKRLKSAELLIENNIPTTMIAGYVVYDKTARDKLISFGIDNNKIIIKKEYYF